MLRARARPMPQTCRPGYHVLLTANLRLQTPTERDLPIIRAAGSDPEAQRWLGWTAPLLIPESRRARLLTMEPGRGRPQTMSLTHLLLAVDQASGLAAGGAVLDVGFFRGDGWLAPGFRGRGLGRELFAALAQFGHDHLGLSTVRAGTAEANYACVAALLAAGFEPFQVPHPLYLPDGRVVPARWFRHDTELPARCQG